MEKKSELLVGLNHMANILGPVILIGILVWVILGNVLNGLLRNPNLTELIVTIVMMLIIFAYIFRASKYIVSKYEFNDINKVSLISTISFFIINFLFVIILSILAFSFGGKSDVGYIELLVKVLGLNSIYTYLFLVILYVPYYFLTLKSLNKYNTNIKNNN